MPKHALASLLGALALLSGNGEARAAGTVVGGPTDTPSIAWARLAVANVPERTATWAQVHVDGAKAGFAWLVPVGAGARISDAPDSWLDALDGATAVRIEPPPGDAPCPVDRTPELASRPTDAATTTAASAAIAQDFTSLTASLDAAGFVLADPARDDVAAVFASGRAVLALVYPPGADAVVTHALRILDDIPALAPLGTTRAETAPVPVTAFLLGSGRAQLGSSPAQTVDGSRVLWSPDGTSTYRATRDALAMAAPDAWVLESAGGDLLRAAVERFGTTSELDAAGVELASGWVTRAYVAVPPGTKGRDLGVSILGGSAVSEAVAASGYDGCPPTPRGPGGGSTGNTPPAPPASSSQAPADPADPAAGAAAVAAAADGCSSSSDSSNDSSSDSCSSSDPPDSGTESSSSSSGGGSSSSDGCGSSSSDESSQSACVVSSRPRGRSPLSRIVLLAACAAFFGRRAARRGRT